MAHPLESGRGPRGDGRGLVAARQGRHHRGPQAADRPLPPRRPARLHESRRAVHAHAESGVRPGLPGGLSGRDLPDLGVSGAGALRAGEAAHHPRAGRRCRAVPRRRNRLLPVAPAGRPEGAARLPAHRPHRDDYDRPLLRDGGAVRRRVRAHRRAAPRRDDPRGSGNRDAAVSGTAAALRDRDCRLPRRDPDAARRRVDDADAGAAVTAVRAEHLVRVGREPAAGTPCGGGNDGPDRAWHRIGPRAESSPPAAATVAASRRGATRRCARHSSRREAARHDGFGHGPQGRSPHRTVSFLPSLRRRDGLAAETPGLPHHALHVRHVCGRGRQPDDFFAEGSVRRPRRHPGAG